MTDAAGGYSLATMMMRLNTDGSLDTSFSNGSTDTFWDGGDGMAGIAPISGNGFGVHEVALQADGKILAVGTGVGFPLSIWRLNSDGTHDLTWGTNSLLALPIVGPSGLTPTSLILQPDGKILVGGYARMVVMGGLQ